MARGKQFLILCEDRMHENFVYHYLLSRGCTADRIRVVPKRGGSAEQFVRAQFPVSVRQHRSKRHHRAGALIAVTDADHLTVQERHRTLDDALTRAGYDRLGADEGVAVLIPKRNIETWVYHLLGEPVDEDTNYKPRYLDGQDAARACKKAARALHEHRGSSDCCPPSLSTGHEEIRRVI